MVVSMDAASNDQTMASPMDESTNFNQPSRRQESADEELNEDEQSKASVQTIVVKAHHHHHHHHHHQRQQQQQQQQQLKRLDSQTEQPDDASSAMVVSRGSSLDEERKLMMHVDDDADNTPQELTTDEQNAFVEAENKATEIMKQLKQQSAKQISTQEIGRKDSLVARMREIVEGTAMQQQPQKPKTSGGVDPPNNQAENNNNNKASIGSQNQQQLQHQKRSKHASRVHGCSRHHHHHHHHRPSITTLNSGIPTTTTSSGASEHQHRASNTQTGHQHGHAHRHHYHPHHHSHQATRTVDSKRSSSGQRQVSTQSNDPRQLQDLESTMGDRSSDKNVPANDKSSTSSVSSAPQAPPASTPATTSGQQLQPTDPGHGADVDVESKKTICHHHHLAGHHNNGHHHHHHHHHHHLGQNAGQHPHHHHHYHNHHARHHHHHHRNHKKRLVLDVGDSDGQQGTSEQHPCLPDKGRSAEDELEQQPNSRRHEDEPEVLTGDDNRTTIEQEGAGSSSKRAPLQEMNDSNVVDNFCCAYHERHQCSTVQQVGGQLKHHHHHHHHHNHGHQHHHHHQLHSQTVEPIQKRDASFVTRDEQQQQQVSSAQHRHHHHRHHHHHNHHHHGHHNKQRHRNKHKTSSNSDMNINQDFQEQQQSSVKDASDSTMADHERCMIKPADAIEGATTVCDGVSVSGREEFDSESKMHLDNEESGADRTRNLEDQEKQIIGDQYTSTNISANNEVVTMDMSPYSENKPHRRTDLVQDTPNTDLMVTELADISGDLDKNQLTSLLKATDATQDGSQVSSNAVRQQKQDVDEEITNKDLDSGVKQNEKDAIRQASNQTNYEFARNQEGDGLREVQDNLSQYNGNNKQASDQRLVRQMSSSRENSQKEVVGAGAGAGASASASASTSASASASASTGASASASASASANASAGPGPGAGTGTGTGNGPGAGAGAAGNNRRQQSQQQEPHIECLPETYQHDQQQVSQPKQIIQSTVLPDRRCRLCWCCCCPCSGLSNKSNAIKAEVKPAIEQPSSSTNKCLSVPNVPLEEIRMWGDSFDRLMKCPDGRKIFQDFLRCEYSEENILFWIACEELKSEKDAKGIATKARDIYEDYISILSAKEVSLDSRVRDVINNNIKKPTSNIFDEAQLQIYTLMHRDSYPRFINSAMYKKLAQIQTNSRKGSS